MAIAGGTSASAVTEAPATSTPAPASTTAPAVETEAPAVTAAAQITLPTELTSSQSFSIALTDADMDNLSYAELLLLLDLNDEGDTGTCLLSLGRVRDTWVDWTGNRVYAVFDGTWPSIDGLQVVLIDQAVTERVRRSLVPVMLNGTTMTYLVVQFEQGSHEGTILGTSQGWDDHDLPVRGITELTVGDTFTPVYSFYSSDEAAASLEEMSVSSIWYQDEDMQIVWDGTQKVTYTDLR